MKEPITVESSLDPDGVLRPRSFHWRGRRYTVRSHGRRWQHSGWIHFLVQIDRQRTCELALEPREGRWNLLRGPGDFGRSRRTETV